LVAWRGGFGDPAVPNPAATGRTLCYDLPAAKLITKEAKAARDGPVTETGVYSFAGLEDNYFTALFLPANNSQIDFRTLSDTVASSLNPKEEARVGAAVGAAGPNEFAVFVGPKDVDVLRKVDPKLEQVVDWGWFGFIAKPLSLILNWINDAAVHNYGWSIIIVTIIINFALLPLKLTSMKSMKKMQALQPQIAAINAKYKNIGLRDPRKAEQNQEVMELYKKHGVNPMGGCIPMLVQIPFFFAFYKVLMVAIEMRGANWLWVADLSQPEHLPIRILPVAMVISQFVMQKMTPATSADPTQQKMMLFMPLVFGFMFYQFQSGLVLYWLTSNLVGIGQQWLINKTTPPVVMAPEPGKKKKTSGGGR
jgi:YidC/Oxa1 family membrane protein insertase